MPLKVGDTFFMANTGGAANPAGSHLMVCIVSKTPEANAVIVPIVTRREHSDTSCLLHVGDHPFIKHESCASYDFIRAIPIDSIDSDIADGEIVLQKPVSAKVLVRLQIGLVISDEVEPWAYQAAQGAELELFLKHRGHM